MKFPRFISGKLLLLLAGLLCYGTAIQAETLPWWIKLIDPDRQITEETPIEPKLVTEETKNSECLDCHGVEGFAVPTGETGDTRKRSVHVDPEVFADSVHAKERCVACHTDIEQMPHKPDVERSVDCVSCHEKEVSEQKVLENSSQYLASIHAQQNKDDPSRVNATCWDCHGTHNVFPMESTEAQTYRLSTPTTCGRCHKEALDVYNTSIHGAKVKRHGNLEAAVCSDCHSAHKIAPPEEDPAKLLITENCGDCHDEEYRSYRHTYHGQVVKLGYTHTAKCFDCHEHHKTQAIDNVNSKAHESNRLATCKECHDNATAGYATFQPHGHAHDFERYPEIWIVSKFMIALVIGVFLFFWTHSAVWFVREYIDRKKGHAHAHIHLDENGDPVKQEEAHQGKYVERFSWPWRLAHLLLAIAVMVLVLTGTAVLYADSFWAPTVMKLLGGPEVAAVIHRIAATTFGTLFFGHLVVVFYNIFVVGRGTFRWFGPTSLLPRWQDFYDFWAMCKWFVGKGPRPVFDRWTYWEKFDYWAPFWGMFVIGLSGLVLWFPPFFASFLPGWIFNIATIVHGEEAFLAAVFLFTVHYFNSHFRPDKFPQDTIMFTGRMTLEEFLEERKFEYERLKKAGTFEQYIVDAPSARMTRYSEILGFVLIAAGLILLFLVLVGFVQGFS